MEINKQQNTAEQTVRALVQRSHRGPKDLTLTPDHCRPTPGSGEYLIRVGAAGPSPLRSPSPAGLEISRSQQLPVAASVVSCVLVLETDVRRESLAPALRRHDRSRKEVHMSSSPSSTDETPEPSAGRPDPPAPASRDAQQSLVRRALAHFLPGTEGLSGPRALLVYIAAVTAAAVLLAGAAYLLSFRLDLFTTPQRVRAEQNEDDRLDAQKPPFTAGVAYAPPPPVWKIVLDRTLTPAEARRLESMSKDDRFSERAWEFLRPLGGRMVRYPTTLKLTSLPPDYDPQTPRPSDATVFTMNLLSERKSQLSIVGMKAVDVVCHTPTAKTVVEYPTQGEQVYAGVRFDLTDDDAEPIITDEGSDMGEPYFTHRKIDLGGGLEPGGLRVEALVLDKSCEWRVKARYQEASGRTGEVVVGDGKKPFFAEALPSKPEQFWIMDFGHPVRPRLVACHKHPENLSCAARTKADSGTR